MMELRKKPDRANIKMTLIVEVYIGENVTFFLSLSERGKKIFSWSCPVQTRIFIWLYVANVAKNPLYLIIFEVRRNLDKDWNIEEPAKLISYSLISRFFKLRIYKLFNEKWMLSFTSYIKKINKLSFLKKL